MSIHELGGGKPYRIPPKPHFGDVARSKPSGESTQSENGRRGVHRVRDPEIVSLIRQLDRSPEIRTDLVEQVKQKLESGEYQTREAAENVASEILRNFQI